MLTGRKHFFSGASRSTEGRSALRTQKLRRQREAVRAAQVQRAKELIADAGYPPPSVLGKVATKLLGKAQASRRSSKARFN